MWVTSLGLAGEAGIFASLPFYPMFSGVPNGLLRLSPPQVHAAVHNSGIITLFRTRGANEIIDDLWLYGARDYRNIGHKAIFVASFWRTLQTIGWQHAEPALRSLVSGLLGYGASEEVNGYAYDDQCYLPNLVLAR